MRMRRVISLSEKLPVSLAVAGLNITLESLIRELRTMAEGDVSDARIEEIFDARHWLQGLRRFGNLEKAELHWMSRAAPGNEGGYSPGRICRTMIGLLFGREDAR